MLWEELEIGIEVRFSHLLTEDLCISFLGVQKEDRLYEWWEGFEEVKIYI